ncbi:MAG TPA: ATP-binding protein [Spirochaetota bacterium]|nr:ATP-binding protein [Spirochaetota bacterium]
MQSSAALNLRKIREIIYERLRAHDVVFLIGIFVFSAVLVLGLFPSVDTQGEAARSFFFYSMMMVPVVAAVYFIIISFRRKLSSGPSEAFFSIRFKIALAFVFVAILPSLPIILVSNNIIGHTISELIAEKTALALEESVEMAKASIAEEYAGVERELDSLDFALGRGIMSPATPFGRDTMVSLLASRGYGAAFFRPGATVPVAIDPLPGAAYADGIAKFLDVVKPRRGTAVYAISIGEDSIALGTFFPGDYLVAVFRVMPKQLFIQSALFEESLGTYRQKEYLKPYFQTGVGIFMLLIAFLIVVVSVVVSLLLSANITRPVLELEEAAGKVAAGDFAVRLERDSPDELALLFDSFNKMIRQLEASRKAQFHAQKLEAWRDVARKLVHEIKNPLTPIRLSAERIQRRYRESHPDIGSIILTGTDTIIEEVNVLMELLGEFSRFARLPEMKPETVDLNPIIESCVNLFHGHERVSFHLELDQSLPRITLDRSLLRQALTNIIQNSIDAVGDQGNIFIKTELLIQADSRAVLIRMRDDGLGINEEDLDRIFEPTFSKKPHGTGLGLTIVEKIILEHRGSITCRSKPGEGTEFTIELPIKVAGAEPDGDNTGS